LDGNGVRREVESSTTGARARRRAPTHPVRRRRPALHASAPAFARRRLALGAQLFPAYARRDEGRRGGWVPEQAELSVSRRTRRSRPNNQPRAAGAVSSAAGPHDEPRAGRRPAPSSPLALPSSSDPRTGEGSPAGRPGPAAALPDAASPARIIAARVGVGAGGDTRLVAAGCGCVHAVHNCQWRWTPDGALLCSAALADEVMIAASPFFLLRHSTVCRCMENQAWHGIPSTNNKGKRICAL